MIRRILSRLRLFILVLAAVALTSSCATFGVAKAIGGIIVDCTKEQVRGGWLTVLGQVAEIVAAGVTGGLDGAVAALDAEALEYGSDIVACAVARKATAPPAPPTFASLGSQRTGADVARAWLAVRDFHPVNVGQ